MGAASFVLTHQSVVEESMPPEKLWNLGNLLLILSQIPFKKGGRMLGICLPQWGEVPGIPSLGNILTRDRITYLLVSFFCEPLCSGMCAYLNSARVTVAF